MEPIIQLEHVSYRYPDTAQEALRDLCLSVAPGEFVAVLGRNGSGKSTLARLLNAILVPTAGRVRVVGLDTADEALWMQVRRTVGMVFQNPDNQIVASVVENDVAFAPENLGLPPDEIRRRVDEALRSVDMYGYRMHAPHLLSGGQKQRVAIAGVIAMRPRVLVMDEPTAMLDPAGRREVLSTIGMLRERFGMTVLLITHHMEECIDADRLLVMEDGRVAADGKPAAVFADVETMHARGLSSPETTELMWALTRGGVNLPLDGPDPEACAQAIAMQFKR